MTKVGIIGAVTMGSTIAVAVSLSSYEVTVFDVSDQVLNVSNKRITRIINKGVEKGKVEEKRANWALASMSFSNDLELVSELELIIEAIPESLELKKKVIGQIINSTADDVIIASNTSSLSIGELASSVRRPDRFVGMHFFNPANIMPLVELVYIEETSIEVKKKVNEFVTSLGKTAVESKDLPGFIVNRVARPFYGEALKLLGENVADVSTIDQLMRSIGFPMGPFELIDLVGCDVNLSVSKSIYNAYFQDPRYRPHPIQERMVKSGRLGRKSGRGFYDYN
jgi:3-hydroxybutyryl-CoA dehydrogenase